MATPAALRRCRGCLSVGGRCCVRRKFFTIVLSIVRFGHATSLLQWAGVVLVFSGLATEIVNKYLAQRKGKKQA